MVMTRPLREPLLHRRARPLLHRRARPLLRRRARRFLSAFVKLRGGKPTEEVFDASQVARMLRSGQSEGAHYYLQRFLLRVPVQDRSPLSDQLLLKVGLFKTLAAVAGGGEDGALLASMYEDPSDETLESPACARTHKIITKMQADPLWASKIWQQIEPGQVNKIMDMVSRCPDLQGEVRLPRKRILLWDPITRGLCKCPSRRMKTTNHAQPDVIVRKFLLQKKLLIAQGRNGSAHSGNLSSHSARQHTQMERVAVQPAVPEAEGCPSNASSSVVLNTQSEQIARKPINLAGFNSNGTSDSMISDMQIEPAVPLAPEASATVVAGLLGGNGSLGNKAQVD